ncbi:hypothetical protein NCS52_00991500 [Fusarium sp. LHS14.1]|nr:hypothetical protein NCS52_00991500 [Fusarium sp. LHS14.1]
MLAMSKMSNPALRMSVLAAAAVTLLVILFTLFQEPLKAPLDYAHQKAQQYCDQSFKDNSTPGTKAEELASDDPVPAEARNCVDPYRRPGYLYIPQDAKQYHDTRYIPYTEEYLNADAPEYAQYPAAEGELIFNATEVEAEFLESPANPQPWMQKAVAEHRRRTEAAQQSKEGNLTVEDFVSMKNDAELGWLWGRRVVMFSDSVDRYMTQFFCEEFDGEITFPVKDESGRFSKGICDVPAFNLTLVYLHSTGSFTYKPKWWWKPKIKYVAWEERWEKLWKPHESPIQGEKGRPDLILWQNGLWDQRAFWEGGSAMHNPEELRIAEKGRQMVWQEVRFVTARIRKIAQRLNDEFGADAPIMFRSLTVHRETGMGDAIMFDLDRLGRAVAEQAGHEVFEWGRLITLLGTLYRDQMHPGKGPGSWLWGNMLLEYLARSVGAKVGGETRSPYFDGWDACHKDLSGWGGR